MILVGVYFSFDHEKEFSEADYKEFAMEIESSVNKGDALFFNNAVAFKLLERRILKKNPGITDYEGFKLSLMITLKFGTKEIELIKERGDFRFLKYYEKNNVPHIIFRTYSKGQIKISDYELCVFHEKIKICDVYYYAAGDYLSEYASESLNRRRTTLANLSSRELEMIHSKFDLFEGLVNNEKYDDAEVLMEELDVFFNDNRGYRLFKLKVASRKDSETYDKAIEVFLKDFKSDERFLAFFNMVNSMSTGDVERTKEAIETLEKYTGKDPVYSIFLGHSFFGAFEYKKSLSCYEEIIKDFPSLIDGYWYKLYAYCYDE